VIKIEMRLPDVWFNASLQARFTNRKTSDPSSNHGNIARF
jgi:hypothetical protein